MAVSRAAGVKPAETVLQEILREIAVPDAVLEEARRRRDEVLDIAGSHPAARDSYASGSVAHGTTNKPLEDADGGILVNRRRPELRAFGPDVPGGGRGPRPFVQMFADYIGPRLRRRYPEATLDLSGKRAIKVEFHQPVEIDEWGEVDPYVDLIIGLAMARGQGLWIPNLYADRWDPGDPIYHTWLMTERDERAVRVHRARVLRLGKRAVKRDELVEGLVKVMCSWNLSALALEAIDSADTLTDGLLEFLRYASAEIGEALTEDPSPAIEDPIRLPAGVTREMAADRLGEMAEHVDAALEASSIAGARAHLEALFGPEIDAVKARQAAAISGAYERTDREALGAALGVPALPKLSRSDGA